MYEVNEKTLKALNDLKEVISENDFISILSKFNLTNETFLEQFKAINKKMEKIEIQRTPILFHNACGFRKSFLLTINSLRENQNSSDEILFPSSVINAMFSLELYIKFLQVYESYKNAGNFDKGHYIYDLFLKLSPETQNEIKKELDDKLFNFMSKFSKNNRNNNSNDLYTDIIQWRYLDQNTLNYKTDLDNLILLVDYFYNYTKRKNDAFNIQFPGIKLPEFESPLLSEKSKEILKDI